MEGFGWYTYEICKRLVEDHPEHEFIFFFDRPYHPEFIFGKNVTPVVLRPAARHPLLFILWFDLLIPRALKKYKLDLFFSPDGYLSLRTDIPQVCTIHDINFEHYPKDLPSSARWYLRRYFPRFAKKADHLITVSECSKKDICETYTIQPQKVTAIWNDASDQFKPLSSPDIQKIRDGISMGKPYFLFVGSIHPRKNLNRLLQAYQSYLSTAASPWHLVIVGEQMWKGKGLNIELSPENMNLIHFTGRLDQQKLAETMGAAGALTFVPYFEGFGIPLVEAMKCGVPILSGDRSCLPEISGNAAVYCDPFNVDSICQQLIILSSNQALLNDLSERGLRRSESFSWDNAAKRVWERLSEYLPHQ